MSVKVPNIPSNYSVTPVTIRASASWRKLDIVSHGADAVRSCVETASELGEHKSLTLISVLWRGIMINFITDVPDDGSRISK